MNRQREWIPRSGACSGTSSGNAARAISRFYFLLTTWKKRSVCVTALRSSIAARSSILRASPGTDLSPYWGGNDRRRDSARMYYQRKLLESLENLSDEENEMIWAEEADRRDASWDSSRERGSSATSVLRGARAKLR